jgi:SEC-C motif-containing protein
MQVVNLCPCGSNNPFEQCCGPIIEGQKQAATASALLASRYSAYVLTQIDYLKQSLHPDKQAEFDEKGARKWSTESDWRGLEILNAVEGGPDDEKGEVEFVATFIQDAQTIRHHEKAQFEKKDGIWYFVDGQAVINNQPLRRETPKVGRNEPCPCGSGKKYKKCCGA